MSILCFGAIRKRNIKSNILSGRSQAPITQLVVVKNIFFDDKFHFVNP
uniref:Uncharacterized protein n=1 Tax=Lepeophtheirus salmonis TaxID=72036 RepID=A0A0K2T883_LEPSM